MNPVSANQSQPVEDVSIVAKAVVVTGKAAVVAASVAAFAAAAFASYQLLTLALAVPMAAEPAFNFVARLAAGAICASAVGTFTAAAVYLPFGASDFRMYECTSENAGDISDYLRHGFDGAFACASLNSAAELGNSRIASLASNFAMRVAYIF